MFFAVIDETIQSLSKIFDHIQNNNNSNIVKSVITYKDKSIKKKYFLLLCDRHVKKDFHEHIRKFQKIHLNKLNPEEIKMFLFQPRD